jgi:hypothetical protein
MDQTEYSTLIVFSVFLGIGIVLNAAVLLVILSRKKAIQTAYLLLLVFFHVAILGDLFTALPYVYKSSPIWCLVNESLKYYFGLMHILVIGFLIQGNRLILFNQLNKITYRTRIFAYITIFIFPCAVFFPYIGGDYVVREGSPFCTIIYDRNDGWSIVVEYMWILLILFINGITNAVLVYHIATCESSRIVWEQYFWNVFSYTVIAGLSWIPRFVVMFTFYVADDDSNGNDNLLLREYYYIYFPMLIAAIFYALLFFVNQKFIFSFERHKSTANDTMTFNTNDILTIIEETKGSHSRHHLSFLMSKNLRDLSFFGRKSPSTSPNINAHRKHAHGNRGRTSSAMSSLSDQSTDSKKSKQVSVSDIYEDRKRVISANSQGINLKNINSVENPIHEEKEGERQDDDV